MKLIWTLCRYKVIWTFIQHEIQKKIMGKVGKNFLKKLFLAIFPPFWKKKKKKILEKLGHFSLDFTIIYHYAKNQKKLISGYRENSKLTDGHRQINNGDFIGPSVQTRSPKLNCRSFLLTCKTPRINKINCIK